MAKKTTNKTTKVKHKLRVIPLGGLHEIGKNMTVLEYGDDMIAIDCGLSFPDDEMLGVMCDLDYYRDEAHYDSRVCKIMAERIRDGAGIVTKDNCADSLDRLFAFLRSYDYDSIWDEVPDE